MVDKLLLMMFSWASKCGNICCGHKMFLKEIGNIFLCLGDNFVSLTNVERAGKQGNICVRNNVSSFATILTKRCVLHWFYAAVNYLGERLGCKKVSSNGFKSSRPWVAISDFLCPICLFLFLQSPLSCRRNCDGPHRETQSLVRCLNFRVHTILKSTIINKQNPPAPTL